jgi:hypothetical protein
MNIVQNFLTNNMLNPLLRKGKAVSLHLHSAPRLTLPYLTLPYLTLPYLTLPYLTPNK